MMQPKLIYDSIHGNIELSYFETIILKSSFTNRLHQILQNSTAYLVFPSCKTSRFEHSLGVMHNTSELFLNGLKNSSVTEDYIKDKSRVILELIEKNHHVFDYYYDKDKPEETRPLIFSQYLQRKIGKSATWTQMITDSGHCKEVNEKLIYLLGDVFIEKKLGLFGSNLKCLDKFTFLILYQTVRLYGLLHDIGHLPFSHIFEFTIESAHEIYADKGDENPTIKKIKEIFQEGDKIHEVIGKHLSGLIIQEVERSICNDISLNDESKILQLFSLKCIQLCFDELRKEKNESNLSSLASIVNNTIDSDRLDFVQRDGYVSGVSKSAGNVERIIKLFFLKKSDNSDSLDKFHFLPSIQSLHDVEKMLYDRFNIYRYMVNHHSVKRSDYILQKNIELQLSEELKSIKKRGPITKVDDVIDVIDIIHYIIKGPRSLYESKYSFTQLTDFWLLSFFSKKYFENLYKTINGPGKLDKQLTLLSEIYESKRSFTSLWKRIYNYKSFISNLGKEIIAAKLKINKLDYSSHENFSVDIDRAKLFLLKEIYETLKQSPSPVKQNEQLGKLAVKLISINDSGWCRKIEKYANLESEKQGIIVLVVKTNISDGLKSFELVDNKDGVTTYSFDEMSSLPATLKLEEENSMKFFVYYKNHIEQKDSKEVDTIINQIIISSIVKIIKEIISKFATPKKKAYV